MPLRVPRCLRGLRRRASQTPDGEGARQSAQASRAAPAPPVRDGEAAGALSQFVANPIPSPSLPMARAGSSLEAPAVVAEEACLAAPLLRCEDQQTLVAAAGFDGGGGAGEQSQEAPAFLREEERRRRQQPFETPSALSDCSAFSEGGGLVRSVSVRASSAPQGQQGQEQGQAGSACSASRLGLTEGGGSLPPVESSLDRLASETTGSPRTAVASFGVYLWGLNDSGQLLNGSLPEESPSGAPLSCPPSAVSRLAQKRIFGCCCAPDRTWLWDAGQAVWGGGNNEGGVFDPDGEALVARPRLVDGLSGVTCIAAGPSHTVAILESGCEPVFLALEAGASPLASRRALVGKSLLLPLCAQRLWPSAATRRASWRWVPPPPARATRPRRCK